MIFKRKWITLGVITMLLCCMGATGGFAQNEAGSVGIGTANPDSSAILELFSKDKGLLLPRMTLQQRSTIRRPAEGLLIYQTDFLHGLYLNTRNGWSQVSNTPSLLAATSPTWNIAGNIDADSSSFLGTRNNIPLVFKVNNQFAGLVDNNRSNTFLGYKTGYATQSFNSVVLGAYALQRASTGNDNVVIGYQSMFSHENGQYNVAMGSLSLSSSVFGDKNTAIGAMAGYRSRGNSNVFLGFQAGYFEQGDEKLYINNNASRTPLIYGDFKEKFVGINTATPNNNLSIKADKEGESGLQLQSLKSTSNAKDGNGTSLSVDSLGNVILVKNTGFVTTPTVTTSTFWNNRGNNIQNANDGDVQLTKSLIVGETISGNRLEVADGGLVFKRINARTTPLIANGKALSLDNFGNVILVDNTPPPILSEWQRIGNNITNRNAGKVSIQNELEVSGNVTTNNLTIKTGKIKFDNLSSRSNALASNGKVLTLDAAGNIVLANDGVGNTDPSLWKKTGARVELKSPGQVIIGEGITRTPANFNLFVSKGILAERVRVAVPNSEKWADYVFKPDYRLMPLGDVKKFISTYGHLPNMYAAEEAAETGMDVLEMNVKLLEKVEELTLYGIHADERIEQLETLTKKSNERIEQLEILMKKLAESTN